MPLQKKARPADAKLGLNDPSLPKLEDFKELTGERWKKFMRSVIADIGGEEKMQDLRAAVKPKGRKGLWLKHLSDPQLAEIYYRLVIKNQPIAHVAKLCREVYRINPRWSPSHYKPGLTEFRKRLSGEIQRYGQEGPKKAEVAKEVKRVGHKLYQKVDGLSHLAWAIELQADRIATFREVEANEAHPIKSMNYMIKVLGELCDKYLKRGMDMGILDQAPSEVNINIKAGFDKVMNEVVSGDGTKMIRATQTWLDQMEQHSLIMRKNESTGNYEVVEPDGRSGS